MHPKRGKILICLVEGCSHLARSHAAFPQRFRGRDPLRGLGASSGRRVGAESLPLGGDQCLLAGMWRDRITADEAREAIRDLLALPFVVCDVTALADRAFAIAYQHQQRAYDCLYVALAEWDGAELWTG